MSFEVTYLASTYGLDIALHADEEITALATGAVLSGHITFVAGHEALIATAGRTRLIDLRLICGWTLTPTPPTASLHGVSTAPLVQDNPDHGHQDTLF